MRSFLFSLLLLAACIENPNNRIQVLEERLSTLEREVRDNDFELNNVRSELMNVRVAMVVIPHYYEANKRIDPDYFGKAYNDMDYSRRNTEWCMRTVVHDSESFPTAWFIPTSDEYCVAEKYLIPMPNPRSVPNHLNRK